MRRMGDLGSWEDGGEKVEKVRRNYEEPPCVLSPASRLSLAIDYLLPSTQGRTDGKTRFFLPNKTKLKL